MAGKTCLFCRENYGKKIKAVVLAPQIYSGGKVKWVPVCKTHKSGWWEGSDILRSKRSKYKFRPIEG